MVQACMEAAAEVGGRFLRAHMAAVLGRSILVQLLVEAALEAGSGVQWGHVAAEARCSFLLQLLVEAALEAGNGILQTPRLMHDPKRALLVVCRA